FTNAYAEQWNLTIERQVGSSWLFRATYDGSHDVHLFSERELNPAIFIPGASTLSNVDQRRNYAPNYTSVDALESTGNSSYNALSVSVEKRFRHGYSILSSYTFSKSLDTVSAVVSAGGTQITNPYDRDYDHGLSDFDHTN